MITTEVVPSHCRIRVGITEAHGKAIEESEFPPAGVEYFFMRPRPSSFRWIRSPIKGYLRDFEHDGEDLIEAVISPSCTNRPWIYSVECMQAATAFTLLGRPLPRSWRVAYIKRLLLKDNCRKVVFWSEAGRSTLESYAKIRDPRVLDKTTVIYPSIRRVADKLIQFSDGPPRLLFSGDFFRKGGVHVIDAFERLQKKYPDAVLWVCSDEKKNLDTPNIALRNEFLGRIRANRGIRFGRVPRERMIKDILPKTDVYLLPTYREAFGFALLEAMAFGVPVISTTFFAIPEVVEHEESGFLIDTRNFDSAQLCKGYVVRHIQRDFHDYMTDQVYSYLCKLLESRSLRKRMGRAGVNTARTKFSHDRRNSQMLHVYREALGL